MRTAGVGIGFVILVILSVLVGPWIQMLMFGVAHHQIDFWEVPAISFRDSFWLFIFLYVLAWIYGLTASSVRKNS